MKKVIAIVLLTASLFLSFNLSSQSAVRTKDYSCNQLQQLVQAEKQLAFRGFLGSTPVYSSPRSCGRQGRPVRANWRTKDKFFCTAGFICKPYYADDN